MPDATPPPAGAPFTGLRFRVQAQQFVLALHSVERVLPLMALQAVPGGPAHLAGLLNYRGESLCVVDLGLWLGLPAPEPYHIDTPILITRAGALAAALLVADVFGVETHAATALQMQPPLAEGRLLFTASLHTPEGEALVLDLPQLLANNFFQPSPLGLQPPHQNPDDQPTAKPIAPRGANPF